MKLIGIIGMSGSGKTTLSNMLQKDDSIGVIHTDDLTQLKLLRKLLPKELVKNYKNANGEEFIVPKNDKLIDILYFFRKNKIINTLYAKIMASLEIININKQLKKFNKDHKKTVIIERRKIRLF